MYGIREFWINQDARRYNQPKWCLGGCEFIYYKNDAERRPPRQKSLVLLVSSNWHALFHPTSNKKTITRKSSCYFASMCRSCHVYPNYVVSPLVFQRSKQRLIKSATRKETTLGTKQEKMPLSPTPVSVTNCLSNWESWCTDTIYCRFHDGCVCDPLC